MKGQILSFALVSATVISLSPLAYIAHDIDQQTAARSSGRLNINSSCWLLCVELMSLDM